MAIRTTITSQKHNDNIYQNVSYYPTILYLGIYLIHVYMHTYVFTQVNKNVNIFTEATT